MTSVVVSFSLGSLWTQEILNYINRKEFEPLLKVDQLNLEREKNKVFLRFGWYIYIYTNCTFNDYLDIQMLRMWKKQTNTFVTVMCEHVLFCLQWRRKSLSLPPTDMNVVLGTRMCGKSRRRPEYVFFFFFTLTASQIQKT